MREKKSGHGNPELRWLLFLLIIAFTPLLGAAFLGGGLSVLVAVSPQVTITDVETDARSAQFAFESDRSSAAFECRLDDGQWTDCDSPVLFEDVRAAAHTFRVRAFDPSAPRVSLPSVHEWDTTLPMPTGTPSAAATPTRASTVPATTEPSPMATTSPTVTPTPTRPPVPPDLFVDVSSPGAEIAGYEIDTVTIDVANRGEEPSGPTTVDVILVEWSSVGSTGVPVQPYAEMVLSSWPVHELAAGEAHTIETGPAQIPEEFRDAVEYVVCASVDPSGEIDESDESNNVACSRPFRIVPMPDLIVAIAGPPRGAYPPGYPIGELMVVNVGNQGTRASGPTVVGLFFREATFSGRLDGVEDLLEGIERLDRLAPRLSPLIDPLVAGVIELDPLMPGESVSLDTSSLTVPSRLADTRVVVCAEVDPEQIVVESDESNNARCSLAFQVEPFVVD